MRYVFGVTTADADALNGYRSISAVTFDLDGELSANIGWVIFEVNEERPERCSGMIGTFNNHATLKLIRFAHSEKPCRICGLFDDGKTDARTWMLGGIVFTSSFVLDASGFVGFRAGTIT